MFDITHYLLTSVAKNQGDSTDIFVNSLELLLVIHSENSFEEHAFTGNSPVECQKNVFHLHPN